MKIRHHKGFTLIELLTIIAILGVLAYMGSTAFQMYKSTAAYGVIAQTLADARRAVEAGISNFDLPPGAVNVSQSARGEMQDAGARALMPGFRLPRGVKIDVSYNPECLDLGCEQAYIELRHCQAKEHLRWVRYGDGLDMLLEHLAGGGC